MVVYVSPAELNGGILQFSISITRETRKFKECKLFLPNVVDRRFFEDITEDVVAYNKVKTLRSDSRDVFHIARQIMSFSPELVIFLEDSILMQQVNRILNKTRIKTAVVVHDIHHHPYRKMGMRRSLVDAIRRVMTRKTIKRCASIILLSENSAKAFKNKYNNDNIVVFRLPAHVPKEQPTIPKELIDVSNRFFLFFGRIDEYKGINKLCRAYSSLPQASKEKFKLIIAGKGILSNEEVDLIKAEPQIHLLNRFMEDGEMVWLFQNSSAVIMPYTEASQSGVLPIAYSFGKPVVVSNLPGLTENVSMNKTGYVFETVQELTDVLCQFDNDSFSEEEIMEYCEMNFSWQSNLKILLGVLKTKESDD